MKYIFILLSFLFLSSCSVNKTFYEDGIIKTKKFKTSKGQKTKNYYKTGTLFSVKTERTENINRTLHTGKITNEKIIITKLKGFYKTGLRKKKFVFIFIITSHGFVNEYKLLEYNKKCNLIRQIEYNYFDRSIKSGDVVKSGKGLELEFSQDTMLRYINRVRENTPN